MGARKNDPLVSGYVREIAISGVFHALCDSVWKVGDIPEHGAQGGGRTVSLQPSCKWISASAVTGRAANHCGEISREK